VIGAAGLAALAFTHSVSAMIAVAGAVGFSISVLRPALTSLVTRFAARSEQGSILGLTQSLQCIASILAPFLSGLLIDHDLMAAWGLMTAGGLFAGLLFRKPAQIETIHQREEAVPAAHEPGR
jgi:MFS family permease